MADTNVRPVRSRGDRRRFLQLPWQIYRNDPCWVPPLRYHQKQLVGFAAHPFYQQASAEAFLAERAGETLGRILAIENRAYLSRYPKDPCGFIGFFESVNDREVAHALFDAARDWLAARQLHVIRGPANPSHNYEWGLLIRPSDMPPSFLMTYNPNYYVDLWESYGFVKAQDLLTFSGHKDVLSTLGKKIYMVAQEAKKRFRVKVRPMEPRHFVRDMGIFLHLYNQACAGNWGHIPMSPAEVLAVGHGMKHLIVPELAQIAEIDGKPVGAVLGLLDYNSIIRQMDGRLLPWGFLKILRQKRQLRRLRIVSTNVLPEYQRWGVGVVLASYLVPAAMEWPVDTGEFSWVLESNDLSRKSLESANLFMEKVHRVYEFNG